MRSGDQTRGDETHFRDVLDKVREGEGLTFASWATTVGEGRPAGPISSAADIAVGSFMFFYSNLCTFIIQQFLVQSSPWLVSY